MLVPLLAPIPFLSLLPWSPVQLTILMPKSWGLWVSPMLVAPGLSLLLRLRSPVQNELNPILTSFPHPRCHPPTPRSPVSTPGHPVTLPTGTFNSLCLGHPFPTFHTPVPSLLSFSAHMVSHRDPRLNTGLKKDFFPSHSVLETGFLFLKAPITACPSELLFVVCLLDGHTTREGLCIVPSAVLGTQVGCRQRAGLRGAHGRCPSCWAEGPGSRLLAAGSRCAVRVPAGHWLPRTTGGGVVSSVSRPRRRLLNCPLVLLFCSLRSAVV